MLRGNPRAAIHAVRFVTGLRKGRKVSGGDGGHEKTTQARPFLL
jgi:hypothetical protein